MLSPADRRWLAEAVRLGTRAAPSDRAFSVGAVVVGADGTELTRGYSREELPEDHAEEGALRRAVAAGVELAGATVYSSLEPCGQRLSRPTPCADLIIRLGIRRVVYALPEPDLFVPAHGAEQLRAAGVDVLVWPALAGSVRAANAHILG